MLVQNLSIIVLKHKSKVAQSNVKEYPEKLNNAISINGLQMLF
jgi:hypothetical protein